MAGVTTGRNCAVLGCMNYAFQKDSRSMFRFPRDYDLCKKWVVASRWKNLEAVLKTHGPERLNNSYRICADHFNKTCFRNPKLLSQGLLKGSIPTLLLGVNTPQQPSQRKRYRELSLADADHSDLETPCTSPLPGLQSSSHESGGVPKPRCVNVADFHSCCRLCVTSNEPDKMTPLFVDPVRSISSKITNAIRVQVEEGDGLPSSICNICVAKLNLVHEFIEKSLAADKLLRKALGQMLDAQDICPSDFLEVEAGDSFEAERMALSPKPTSIEKAISNKGIPIIKKEKPSVSEKLTNSIDCKPITSLCIPTVAEGLPITIKCKPISSLCQPIVSKVASNATEDELSATEGSHSISQSSKLAAEPVRPKGVKCDTCGKWLLTAAVLRNHMKLHIVKLCTSRSLKLPADSTRPNGLKCDLCGKFFRCGAVLRDHMNIHTGERPYMCAICGKGYPRQDTLTAHELLHTETVARFECNICGERTFSAIRLRNHMTMHSDLRPFLCAVCSKGFKRKSGLLGHMRSHVVGKPFCCDICGKRFKREMTCAAHKAAHGRPPPPPQERKFQCHLCGKALRYKHSLESHEARHKGIEGTFECCHCSKRFMDRDGVKRHITVNHIEQPQVCTVCARSFKLASYVKKHMLKVHGIVGNTFVGKTRQPNT